MMEYLHVCMWSPVARLILMILLFPTPWHKVVSYKAPPTSTHQQLVLLLPVEPDHKQTDAVLRQALPGPHKVHLGLQQVQVLHVGV